MKMNLLAAGAIIAGLGTASAWADTGKALIHSTSTSTVVSGMVTLQDTPQGLKIDADVMSAPPGLHAFHIHEFGSCDDQAKAAGSHYNPAGHQHGNTIKDGVAKTHAGDFGSLTIDAKGQGTLHAVIPGLQLSKGDMPVAGRAFVLHEKADDFSQPTGNAGGRIGCGTIIITGK